MWSLFIELDDFIEFDFMLSLFIEFDFIAPDFIEPDIMWLLFIECMAFGLGLGEAIVWAMAGAADRTAAMMSAETNRIRNTPTAVVVL